MFVKKNFSLREVFIFSGVHVIWLLIWSSIVTCIYHFTSWNIIRIPWLPLSVIGTAVAFYIGFKNNQAYDRLWEARKIWGGIVNSSRSWGSVVRAYVRNHFDHTHIEDVKVKLTWERLIYRHIAWLYTLREQLLIPAPWEHINQSVHIRRMVAKRMTKYGTGTLDGGYIEDLKNLLSAEELNKLPHFKNAATQLIDIQSQELAALKKEDLIEDFRHMEMQNILNEFYALQGKCERIKKFPLPRQYGNMSMIFVGIFIFLLPFGMIPEFQKLGEYGIWVSIPLTALVSWVYLVMELVGDYSENPFEGLGNDIPMMSLCRTIEIDLRQMLGEDNLPEPIESKNGVLM
ncbi:MAG: hypothetical protein JXR03_03210 [Cyclobacteriaceae bacterium]